MTHQEGDVKNSHDPVDLYTGKLLVLRYQSSEFVHNAATAAANALQEPGMLSV
jgi:hypothetical protein